MLKLIFCYENTLKEHSRTLKYSRPIFWSCWTDNSEMWTDFFSPFFAGADDAGVLATCEGSFAFSVCVHSMVNLNQSNDYITVQKWSKSIQETQSSTQLILFSLFCQWRGKNSWVKARDDSRVCFRRKISEFFYVLFFVEVDSVLRG